MEISVRDAAALWDSVARFPGVIRAAVAADRGLVPIGHSQR
jgi:hypothetical protein